MDVVGNEYLPTMVDVTSRYVDAVPADVICGNLNGVPYRPHSDAGSYFVGGIFGNFCTLLGFNHAVGSSCYPQTQGTVDRSHQTLKGVLKKFALHFGTDWEDNLPYFFICA